MPDKALMHFVKPTLACVSRGLYRTARTMLMSAEHASTKKNKWETYTRRHSSRRRPGYSSPKMGAPTACCTSHDRATLSDPVNTLVLETLRTRSWRIHSPNVATWLAALWHRSYDSHGTGSGSSEGEPCLAKLRNEFYEPFYFTERGRYVTHSEPFGMLLAT